MMGILGFLLWGDFGRDVLVGKFGAAIMLVAELASTILWPPHFTTE
jgi:hypothetical protein